MRDSVKSFSGEKPEKAKAPARRRKITVWLTRIMLGLVGLYLLALAAIYVYLQRDPQALVQQYLGSISEKTGLKFSIGSVEATLAPLPAIAVSNVRVTGPNMLLTIAWCQLAPSPTRIFSGNFLPGAITILRPQLDLQTNLNLDDPAELAKLRKPDSKSANLSWLDMSLEVLDLGLRLKGAGDTSLRLAGLDAVVDMRPDGRIEGVARFSSLAAFRKTVNVALLEKFQIAGAANINDFLTATPRLTLNGQVKWLHVLAKSKFELGFSGDQRGLVANGKISGLFDCEGEPIPFMLRGGAESAQPLATVESRNLEWRLGPDSGNVSLKFMRDNAGNRLEGVFIGNRVSLTEWLGFARNLPPGIQLALDNITSARADFIITGQGLSVPRISAFCAGSLFTGSGAVPNWSKPSVNLKLTSQLVNLGAGLPESLGQSPDAPFFAHAPLTPMPGKPLQPGATGIDYDINLSATTLLYGPIAIRNAAVRIYPGKMDVTRLQDVLLDGKGTLYGGAIKGHCILGADPSLPYHITASAKNVNGNQFGRELPVQPIRQGTYSASATITSRGKTLASFLANLRGQWQIEGQKARLSASSLTFPTIRADGSLRSGAWNGSRLSIDGVWNTDLKHAGWSADCKLDGLLHFGASGLAWTDAPLTLTASFNNGILPRDVQPKISGRSSGNTGKNEYKMTNARLDIAGSAIHGNLTVDGGKEQARGNFSARLANPQQTLNRLGLTSAKLPANFKPANIEAEFAASPDMLKLSKMKASLGDMAFSGDAQWNIKAKRPTYELHLVMDRFKLADEGKSGKTAPNWNYPFMNSFDASGSLRFKELNAYDIKLLNLNLAFKLQSGKLDMDPINANFYGALLKGALNLDFQRGIGFAATTQVNAFDLGAAVKDRKTGVAIKGLASIDARLHGHLADNARLPGALNGTWNMNVANGYWQSLKKNGEPDGSPTTFSRISASGSIKSGVINSGNFVLSSPDMKVTGGGWYNLASNKMDCAFNVNMKNLPDFPIYVYGPVNKLEKRIGAGKMIVNAVGGVASGFVNAIGGALKGAWNIFSN